MATSKNKTANALQVIGLVIALLGIAGSLVLGKVFEIQVESMFFDETRYNWGVAIAGVLCSAISGVLLYGFGEVISLLQANVDNQKQIIASIAETKDKLNG